MQTKEVPVRRAATGLVAVAAVLCGNLLLALTVIPPWQNPDEPQHLLTVRLIGLYGPDFSLDFDREPDAEQAIVASMARHGWWRHYGRPTPDPIPVTFAEGPGAVVASYFGPGASGLPAYYLAVGALFRTIGAHDVVVQMHVMRILSALTALLTLWCVWEGTRILLGERAALVVSSLLVLHPQFVLVSTSATPDAFVNLAGAAFWWRAARFVSDDLAVRNIVLMFLAAAAAFAFRRMGAPLLIIAVGLTVVRAAAALRGRRHGRAVLVVCVAVAVAALAAMSQYTAALGLPAIDLRRSATTIVQRASGLPAFFEMWFTTFWLSAGWLRYPGPEWWRAAMASITFVTIAGLFLRRSAGQRGTMWLMAWMVAAPATAIVVYYFGIVQAGPQGRYLFPVLAPILCAVWIGWRAWFGERQQIAAVSLVGVMAFLGAAAWTSVILPAYL